MTATFRRAALGYSKSEVDEYIAQLRGEIDALREQTQALEGQVRQQKEQIEKYRDQERYISGALLDAQNRAVQIEQRAQENYDRSIMRLAEDSKIWEDRIQKNKERLIALDRMIESFLSGVKAEIGAAHADSGDDWKSALEEADRIMLAQGAQSEKPQQQTEDADAQKERGESDANEKKPPFEVLPQDRGETAQAPQVDGDIHNLYWRLKHLEDGEQPQKPMVDPRAEDSRPKAETREKTSATPGENGKANEQDGMYMPGETEKERLTSILSELGILPTDK